MFIIERGEESGGVRRKSTVTRTKAAHVYGQDAIKAVGSRTPSSSCSLSLLETVQEISFVRNAFTE